MAAPDHPTTDLMDVAPDLLEVCAVELRQFGGRRVWSGPVRTVRCREDNALVRQLAETPSDGAVIVVDGGGSLHTALVGGNVAGAAHDSGWAGLVINGAVRDAAELRDLALGVKAVAATPRPPSKAGDGVIDGPVTLGGVVIRPGDHLWSDEDGVVVARGDDVDEVLDRRG